MFDGMCPQVRKLWAKMADKEWRVSAKALYIVHRFAADGSSEHALNLKESVAVLRTHHDSRRKVCCGVFLVYFSFCMTFRLFVVLHCFLVAQK